MADPSTIDTRFMAEIRTSLDQLAGALEGEEPEEHVKSIVHAHDIGVADAEATIQDMDINEDDIDMDSGGGDTKGTVAARTCIYFKSIL